MNDDEVSKAVAVPISMSLPDGTNLDRLRGGELAMYAGETPVSGMQIEHGGCVYRAGEMDCSLQTALKLPTTVKDGSLHELAGDIQKLFSEQAGLKPKIAALLTAAVLATWVPESVPVPLCQNITGTRGSNSRVAQLFSILVRNPLKLTQVTVRELAQLPGGLCPTLLLTNPSARTIREVGLMTGNPGSYILYKANVMALPSCTSVILSDDPIPVPALHIRLAPVAGETRITSTRLQEIESEYRPRLLGYRLRRHRAVAASTYDCASLSSHFRTYAQVLGSALEGCPDAQEAVLEALREQDEDSRALQSQSDKAYVLEALLVLIHEQRTQVFVKDVAELVNGILIGRHEDGELTPKAVGRILREIGVMTKRRGAGFEVLLPQSARLHIHRAAIDHGTLSTSTPQPDCSYCDELLFDSTDLDSASNRKGEIPDVHKPLPVHNGLPAANNVHDVHKVQEVHDVKDVLEVHDVHELHEGHVEPLDSAPDSNADRGGAAV